jgi:hypothetical protein
MIVLNDQQHRRRDGHDDDHHRAACEYDVYALRSARADGGACPRRPASTTPSMNSVKGRMTGHKTRSGFERYNVS